MLTWGLPLMLLRRPTHPSLPHPAWGPSLGLLQLSEGQDGFLSRVCPGTQVRRCLGEKAQRHSLSLPVLDLCLSCPIPTLLIPHPPFLLSLPPASPRITY